jgi:hypothetical protein
MAAYLKIIYIYARMPVCRGCLLCWNRWSICWSVSSSESLWVTSPEVTMSFVVVAFSAALDRVCCNGYIRRTDGRCIEWMLSAVVCILVLDLRNFQLQTSNFTSWICSYSVGIDSLRVEPFPAV